MTLLIIRNKIIYCFMVFMMLFIILIPQVQADNLKDAFGPNYLNKTADQAGYDKSKTLNDIIAALIAAILSLLGVVFLVLIFYGGFLWMTAQGKEEIVTKAKDLITQAIIGLIIVLAAYAIVYYIISKLSEATLV